ncbi:hypothetical protein ACGF0J_09065 [Nonomuraea sp. NPDC047897]|uniref:hypothetical protein n=1 Tax=Nonomuraea sp. NPDC047897 TaxID=3364346 RepID=UPI003719C08C
MQGIGAMGIRPAIVLSGMSLVSVHGGVGVPTVLYLHEVTAVEAASAALVLVAVQERALPAVSVWPPGAIAAVRGAPPGRTGFVLGSAMGVNQIAVVLAPPALGALKT